MKCFFFLLLLLEMKGMDSKEYSKTKKNYFDKIIGINIQNDVLESL